MEQLLALLDENILYAFLLLFARIVSFVAFMPVFGHKAISPTIRIAFAFYFTIFLFPLVNVQTAVTTSSFMLGLVSEITLGLIGSMLVLVIFSSVTIIGDLIGYATALSMANMFDPASGTQQGVVGRLLYMFILIIFFVTGMYEVTIIMLVKSFETINLGSFNPFDYNGIAIAIDEIKRMFFFAFSFAFPLFFISFILDVYYGYGTKSMPAFSPFIVTFQLKFAMIFLFMMFGFDIFVENFKEYFITKFG